jgi:hypothetical protein
MNIAKFIIVSLWFLQIIPASSSASPLELTCSNAKWTELCFEKSANIRRLKSEYINRVNFQPNGFAVLYIDASESVAINRKGEVVIPGIVSGDFDYTEAEQGVVAFYATKGSFNNRKSSRCRYFQLSNFRIVVPPIYNIWSRFHKQKAYVCIDCELDCVDCHNFDYFGGEGFIINKRNQILKRISLSKIPRCSTVEGRGGFPKDQPCRTEE